MNDYEPFEYDISKDGTVRVFRSNRLVTIVGGKDASTLAAKLGSSPEQDQRLLQRATGNYKRGNERHS